MYGCPCCEECGAVSPPLEPDPQEPSQPGEIAHNALFQKSAQPLQAEVETRCPSMGEAPSKCCRTAEGDGVVTAETQWVEEEAPAATVLADEAAKGQPTAGSHEECAADYFAEANNANERPSNSDQLMVDFPAITAAPADPPGSAASATPVSSPRSEPGQREDLNPQRKKKGLPTGKFAQRAMSRSSTYELDGPDAEAPEDEQQTADCLIDNLVSAALMKGGDRGSTSAPWSESKGGRMSLVFAAPQEDRSEQKKQLIRALFSSDASDNLVKDVEARHSTMQRILPQLFVNDETMVPKIPNYSKQQTVKQVGVLAVRSVSKKIIKTRPFVGFYMLLTFYAIFGPDLVLLLLDKSADFSFQIFNTVVFFLFGIELVLQVLGRHGYVFTMTFVLDLVSVLSILSDTYLLKAINVDQDGARVSRMARSSRMTRLARIVRVARVTRLLPRLMSLCGKQRDMLGKRLMEKRLWRSFLLMAQHSVAPDKISYLDVKCFYLGVLEEGEYMLNHTVKDEILKLDMAILCAQPGEKLVDYAQFKSIVLSTNMGKQLVKYHNANVEREDGVWNLTQKLSDATALKVVCGLLILLGVMALCETTRSDAGPEQGLMQLDRIVKREKVGGVLSASSGSYICEQVAIYARRYIVLYVYLDGATYFDRGRCNPLGLKVTDPFKHADDIIDASSLRRAEVLQSCWRDNEGCSKSGTSSMSLVDVSDSIEAQIKGSLYMTIIVIALLLIFVYVLNLGITNFSKTLLQPLHSLVDDMAAMSMLELVNIDREMPGKEGAKTLRVADELMQLQNACASMRGAIKSWSKFVPPAVVQRLFTHGVEAQIGVARMGVTILFCDIAGFEDATRGLGPEDVLRLLSDVLGNIAKVIDFQRGTLLEFIGDEVLAVFNTPNILRYHTFAGVASALEIHDLVSKMAPIQNGDGRQKPITCRCGVNTCTILAGNIGSSQRMKYGLLGDGVNLTARLKGINSKYQTRTLASDKVIADERVRSKVVTRPIDLVAVKGKKEPTTVFEPIALCSEDPQPIKLAAAKHEEAFGLYKQRQFAQAQALFEEVYLGFEAEGIADEPSKLLSARCKRYILEPPPDDWDGVERLTKK